MKSVDATPRLLLLTVFMNHFYSAFSPSSSGRMLALYPVDRPSIPGLIVPKT